MKNARGRWSKATQNERRNKILRFIVKNPNVNFGELIEEFPVSPATLSGDLRFLESKNRIEHFTDPEKRNVRRYRPTEKAFDVDKALEVVDFIDNMQKHGFVALRISENEMFTSLLLSGVEEKNVAKVRKHLKDRWGERSGLRGRLTFEAAKIFRDFCKREGAERGVFVVGVDTKKK